MILYKYIYILYSNLFLYYKCIDSIDVRIPQHLKSQKKTTLVAKSFKKKSFSSSQKRLLEEFLSLTLFCNDLLKLCVFLQGVPTHWWQGVRLQIFREFWGFLVDGLGIQAKTLGKNVYIHPESSCECFSYFFQHGFEEILFENLARLLIKKTLGIGSNFLEDVLHQDSWDSEKKNSNRDPSTGLL